MKRAIIIEGKAFDWDGASERVDKLLASERPEAAAASADPGVMHCPKCHQWYWNEGDIVQCIECCCTFPTDWSLALRFGMRGQKQFKYGGKTYDCGNWFFKFALEHRELIDGEDMMLRVVSFAYQPKGADLIYLERLEQLAQHGYTAEHDAQHVNQKLVNVAIDLLKGSQDEWGILRRIEKHHSTAHEMYRKQLIVAGALIAAEIDRITREHDEVEIKSSEL